jgi:hypothetical protein
MLSEIRPKYYVILFISSDIITLNYQNSFNHTCNVDDFSMHKLYLSNDKF